MLEENQAPPKPKSKIPLIAGTAVLTSAIAVSALVAGYYGINKMPPPAPNTNEQAEKQKTNQPAEVDLKIKGNKQSRIYHLPRCPNYEDIAERNIVWFKTHEDAKARRYRMARNCP